MILIAFEVIAAYIAAHPETRKLADKALGWAAERVADALTKSPSETRDENIETMRAALQKGDVDAIIDQFNRNIDYANQHRVLGNSSTTG